MSLLIEQKRATPADSAESTTIPQISEAYFQIILDEHARIEAEIARKQDPFGCYAPELRGHIASAHFQAKTMEHYGVARWDIELARYRGFPLDWPIKKACERLGG